MRNLSNAEFKKEIEEILSKGNRSLDAARDLFKKGYYDFAASRAYYAMFYFATAALLTKGLSFSKHSAVIAAFGQHFVKSGILPSILHKKLRNAFDKRNIGDYEYHSAISKQETETILKDTKDFIDRLNKYLKRFRRRIKQRKAVEKKQ